MINITPERIKTIPPASRSVKVSLNTKMPIMTAVNGSSAPRIADGVEPMSRIETVSSINAMIDGTMASIKANPYCRGVVNSIRCVSGLKNE